MKKKLEERIPYLLIGFGVFYTFIYLIYLVWFIIEILPLYFETGVKPTSLIIPIIGIIVSFTITIGSIICGFVLRKKKQKKEMPSIQLITFSIILLIVLIFFSGIPLILSTTSIPIIILTT